ncbi:MAG: hypothetical protein CMN58_06055 [Solibacterales bacterium]|nr:hypothetical protein [Bryobacterales bacterium]
MVTDTRSDGPWKEVEYEGYDPLLIVDLKIHMLGKTFDVPCHGGRPSNGLLRIITEDGVEGWSSDISPDLAYILAGEYKGFSVREHLIGRDALDRERIWHDMLMGQRLFKFPKDLRGAIDIALWDIAGKHLGLPVWRLLGACRDKVPAYTTQGGVHAPEGTTIEHFVNFALKAQADGFLGSKDHCNVGPEFMIKLAEILRDEVGPDFHLMHDAVQYYDLNEAIRVGKALEENGFTWFEEPVRDQDFRSLKKLREAVGIPVVAGENFPHHIHSYGQMLAMGAVDGIKPSVVSGGITETQKLADLTNAFGADIHVQLGGSMWGFATIHANGGIENLVMLEVHENRASRIYPPIKNPLRQIDGYVRMPEGPGLGIDLDWDMVQEDTIEIIE